MQNFIKYENNPVLGSEELGTCFDVCVWQDNGKFRMDFSWRKHASAAVSFSADDINFKKHKTNPILMKNWHNYFEKDRFGG